MKKYANKEEKIKAFNLHVLEKGMLLNALTAKKT